MRLDLLEQPQDVHLPDDRLAGFEAVHAVQAEQVEQNPIVIRR